MCIVWKMGLFQALLALQLVAPVTKVIAQVNPTLPPGGTVPSGVTVPPGGINQQSVQTQLQNQHNHSADQCDCSNVNKDPSCFSLVRILRQKARLHSSLKDEPRKFNGWERRRWMLILLVPLAVFISIAIRYEYLWRRNLRKKEEAWKSRAEDGEKPLVGMVRRMIPALELQSYVFKGIQRPTQQISLKFEDLGLVLKDGQQVLAGVTGQFRAGKLIAAMGPSGAGKTTFLNVLCGKATYGKMTGHVYVNGEERRIQEFNPIMGFVPQDDLVYEKLRVRESLRFSALLRNERGTPNKRIGAIVNDVLTVLSIGHIQTSIVGGVEQRGISGGQRKRVNIGLELAASPTLLFLDEPTSGLDATSSLTIIQSLKKMTELGMTIIMVIHQPRYSLFTLFDTVLLLAKGGRTVYLGEAERAKLYFENIGFGMTLNENPSDWFMDIISGEVENEKDENFRPQDLSDTWNEMGEKLDTIGQTSTDASSFLLPVARTWSSNDDRFVIEEAITEAWLATSAGNAIDKNHLAKLVAYGIGHEPKDELIQELWTGLRSSRISGRSGPSGNEARRPSGKTSGNDSRWAPPSEVVTMDMLVEYFFAVVLEKKKKTNNMSHEESEQHQVIQMRNQALDAADRAVDVMTGAVGAVADGAKTLGRKSIGVAATPVDRIAEIVTAVSTRGVPQSEEPEPPPSSECIVVDGSKKTAGSYQRPAVMTRKIPGPFRQLHIICQRRLIQIYRNIMRRLVDVLVIVGLAVILGVQHKDNAGEPTNVLLFHMALGILIAVNCLPCFGDERPMFWRERSHDLSGVAYCFGRMLIDSIDVFTQATLYVFVYYLVANPPAPFSLFLMPCYCVAFVCSGWGYFVSVLVPRTNATLSAAVLMILMNGAMGDPGKMGEYIDGGFMEWVVVSVCPTRWSVQMFFIQWWKDLNRELIYHADPPLICLATAYRSSFYDKGQSFKKMNVTDSINQSKLADLGDKHWSSAVSALCLEATALRIITIVVLCLRDRDKQV